MAESYQVQRTIGTATDAVAVVKSDATFYDPPLAALWVGGAGNVAVRTRKGSTVTFVGVPAGTMLPQQVDKVLAATTATDIVGLRIDA